MMSQTRHRMELLAPAGDRAALEAAVEAGADAVYLGLTSLNARRGARNFRPEELTDAVQLAHARGARVCLTLNIDLAQRELGQAARILELADHSGVDAVLVRDPALLALRPLYPRLEFHFSTQTCMTSSADVAAAGELGAARVVLGRELTLGEIEAASAVGVPTEVFCQGALCFCVSGRCLLSSWIGGRSGNRGTCTSPCRVPWAVDQQSMGTPLSMRDLATVAHLSELRRAGVCSLKIEGRLKTAEWVRQAVSVYRRALDGTDASDLAADVEKLGAYSGRAMTDGYLTAQRDELTGTFGRASVSLPQAADTETAEAPADAEGDSFDLRIEVTDRGIVCTCSALGGAVEWSLPRTVVRRAHKAVPVNSLLESLGAAPHANWTAGKLTTNQPEFLLVPRAANAIVDRVGAALRQLSKPPSDHVDADLPQPVRDILSPRARLEVNDRALGDKPNRVRLEASAASDFIRRVRASGQADAVPDAIIVEGATEPFITRLATSPLGVPVVVALPQVLFEGDIVPWRQLLAQCAAAGLTVEVNNWGGWLLARRACVRMESGAGLGVLNALAARVLHERGVECITLSCEADRRQLEELCAACDVPCSITVFGRPALMTSRAGLSRDRLLNRTLQDRRGNRIVATQQRGLWIFRPAEPFDLRRISNPRIRARNLVVDLVDSPDPVREWLTPGDLRGGRFRFNYGRSLA